MIREGLILIVTFTVGIIGVVVLHLRPVRLFFLRRQHESILRTVNAEMKAEYPEYETTPEHGERLWRQVLQIHGLEE